MVYHIDLLAYIEESLHPWDKANLIIMFDSFNTLLDFICENFIEDFSICIYIHQGYRPVLLFFVVSVSGFGIRVMMAS